MERRLQLMCVHLGIRLGVHPSNYHCTFVFEKAIKWAVGDYSGWTLGDALSDGSSSNSCALRFPLLLLLACSAARLGGGGGSSSSSITGGSVYVIGRSSPVDSFLYVR